LYRETCHLERTIVILRETQWRKISATSLPVHLSRLTTHLSLRVIFDRKLYREVVWSPKLSRVLDTNFTFFKSKIHSNWHLFKLTFQLSRLFTVHHSFFCIHYYLFNVPYSAFSKPYSLFNIQYPPLTTHDSRLTTHDSRLTTHHSPLTTHHPPLHHYTVPPLTKTSAPINLIIS